MKSEIRDFLAQTRANWKAITQAGQGIESVLVKVTWHFKD